MTRIIRASEVGEYVYCRRAWWLRAVQGHASVNVREMAVGTDAHIRHGKTVAWAGALRTLAVLLLLLAILAGLWPWFWQ